MKFNRGARDMQIIVDYLKEGATSYLKYNILQLHIYQCLYQLVYL